MRESHNNHIHPCARQWLSNWGIPIAALMIIAVLSLLAALSHAIPRASREYDLLASINTEQRIEVLVSALREPYPSVRRYAALRLGQFGSGDAEAIAGLAEALADPESSVRRQALQALQLIAAPKELFTSLESALASDDADTKSEVKRALLELHLDDPCIVPVLISLLSDNEREVRRAAAGSLSRQSSSANAIVPALAKALEDDDILVRTAAAKALGEKNDLADDAIPPLITALRDCDLDVRIYAAEALGNIRIQSQEAIDALTVALQDEYPDVKVEAAGALLEIDPTMNQTIIDPMLEVIRDQGSMWPYVGCRAAEVIGRAGINSPKVRDALVDALAQTSSWRLQISALHAIGELAGSTGMPVNMVIPMLADEHPWVREAAIDVIKVHSREHLELAVQSMVEVAQDADQGIFRGSAIAYLGSLGADAISAVPALEELSHLKNDPYMDEEDLVCFRQAAKSAILRIMPDYPE